jgi:hypothetical protein
MEGPERNDMAGKEIDAGAPAPASRVEDSYWMSLVWL